MNRFTVARFTGAALLAVGLATALSVPATGAPQAGEADSAAMLQAMERDLGLSAEGVQTRIAAESRASSAEQTLTPKLGRSFGGAWFDSSTGTLVVAVTDASKVGEIQAAGATAKVVSRSMAQLDSHKSALDRADASAPKSVTGWYVDVATNSVVVSVLHSDPAGVAWAASQGARTENVTAAPAPLWNLRGGDAITTGGARCSLGFNARRGTTRIVITAGHCTNIGVAWSGTGGSIGNRAFSSFPGNDYGGITVNSAAAVSTALVNRYPGTVTVAGSTRAGIGSSTCRSGSTTGWRCGTVLGFNETVRYPQGAVGGMTRTNACAQPGDSGGSFVSPSVGAGGRVQAQGMTSGGSGNCTSGGTIWFQPVGEVLGAQGLTLVTG